MSIATTAATAGTAASAASAGVVGAVYRCLLRDGEAFRDRVMLGSAGPSDPSARGIVVSTLPDAPDLATHLVEEARRRIERTHEVLVPPYVAATRVLHDYAWPACLLVAAPWFLAGLVPVLASGDVFVLPATGRLVVRPAREIGEGAEAGDVRRVVADHHAPLLDALGPHLRRGHRAAWGTVADDLISGVWWLGRLVDQEPAAVTAATALLPSPQAPYPGAAAFRRIVAEDGSEHVTRTRVACCLQYVMEPDACLTCPRTPESEQRRRLSG